jgi:hypothetical protein
MTIPLVARALLLWFASGLTIAVLLGPLFNHTYCGCRSRSPR